MDANASALLRQMRAELARVSQELLNTRTHVSELSKRSRSVDEEINSIPGRRLVYTLSGEQSFTASQDGLRGNPISMLVSQDGPFIMTHYPIITWRPELPATADNLGLWSPIRSYPMPTQMRSFLNTTSALPTNLDVIDISYELMDSGSTRNFQNTTVGPGLISQPGELIALPVATLFQPNTTVSIVITYHNILFGTAGTDTTGGLLHVDLPGYKIAQM